MASSADQEPNLSNGHSPSSHRQQQQQKQQQQQQQRQQQELIKLLAQHFNHQFYSHLASSASLAGNASQQLRNGPEICQQRALIAQNQGAQYAPEPAASLIGVGGFDLDSKGLMGSVNGNHSLHNQLLRAHRPANEFLSNSSLMPELLATAAAEFNRQNSPSSYQINEMNLVNAFGLNLSSKNQLVLPMHQQSLIQAASAGQYETRNELMSVHHKPDGSEQYRHSNLLLPAADERGAVDLEEHDSSKRKNLLKFSISTILGSGSPKAKTTDQSLGQMSSFSKVCKSSDQDSQLFRNMSAEKDSEHRFETECNLADSGSDSCSMNTSLTPTPISSNNSSILFTDHTLQTNHTSANPNDTICATKSQQQNFHHHGHHGQHTLSYLTGTPAFPWTVAARGKPRRGMMRRAVFSDSQRVGLEKRFQLQKYISKPDRKKLAEKLGLRDSQVKIWFQNRRMKWRNSKERELLSAGGSREQTLPTRNNPNPDLSDVGETIKRLSSMTSNGSFNLNK